MTPTYFIKILSLLGTVIAAPLPCGTVEISPVCYVHGQRALGSCVISLKNPIGADSYLLNVYNLLDYRQRIEVYDVRDRVGTPEWAGVITELPADLGSQEIRGVGVVQLLDDRKLRRYHTLTGIASDLVKTLLNTYQSVFKDNFNRASLGANWIINLAGWSLVSNQMETSSDTAADLVSPSFTLAQWADAHLSFDYAIPIDSIVTVDVLWNNVTMANDYMFQITDRTSAGWVNGKQIQLWTNKASAAIIAERSYELLTDTMLHFEIYTATESGGRRIILLINGVEIINVLDATAGMNTSGTFRIHVDGGHPACFDNFVFRSAAPALVAGDIDATTESIEQTFNGDSQLAALEWLCDHEGCEYIVRPGAGAGNDSLDWGASLGRDLSGVLVFEEGKNIIALRRDRTSDELCTNLFAYGQSSDDGTTNFVSTDLDAYDKYGEIDGEFADERITDPSIARTLGDYELARRSAGTVSLSGRVVDESWLLQQDPRIGYAIVGDTIIGGRQRLQVGDYVWLRSRRLNVDRKARIVQLTRRSGDSGIDLVFDAFAWRQSQELPRLRRQLQQLYRALDKRMDSRTLVFTLTGTTPVSLPVYMRGNYRSVYIDVASADWAESTVAITIDGFGFATVSSNAHFEDTGYLIASGDHTITLTPLSSVTVVVTLVANLLG